MVILYMAFDRFELFKASFNFIGTYNWAFWIDSKYSLNFKTINLIYDLNIIEKKYQAGYTKFLFAFFAHAQVDLKTSSSPFEFFILFKSISKNIIKQNKFCSKRQNNAIINKKRATNISLEI